MIAAWVKRLYLSTNIFMCDSCFHPITPQPLAEELPRLFTYPFQYTPHPLVRLAASEVRRYLQSCVAWHEELQRGKMFGVLLVRNQMNEVGFLAAFSGLLGGSNRQDYFVPPVFDFLDPQGFFKQGEARLTEMNRQVTMLKNREEYLLAHEQLTAVIAEAEEELLRMKEEFRQARLQREQMRRTATPDEVERLNRESQFQKAELKRREKAWAERIAGCRALVEEQEAAIVALKQERKNLSEQLQQQIFQKFTFRNALGEEQSLQQIFCDAGRGEPPAGAGECAAPKLLQYAYLNGLQPLAMGEFWWGDSPRGVLREDGRFYPSCTSKCKPILGFMLQGLDVEPDPVVREACGHREVEVVYEDEYIAAVSKPAGMYSAPGKDEEVPSVWSWAQSRYPDSDSPLLVHRLDMHTSGLLLIGKTKEAHAALQQMFESHQIRKTYIAVLDGVVRQDEGMIRLPLRPDLEHRPMQMVDPVYGKPAVTRYRVLSRDGETTRIAFFPQTGRTHQLRVHAAHPEGLGCPIHGDQLYGRPSDRLYLHAEQVQFVHPVTGQRLTLKVPVPF